MDPTIQRRLAERFRALDERYRALKEGRLPWWHVLWLALRPNFFAWRRLRKALRANHSRARARLQLVHGA